MLDLLVQGVSVQGVCVQGVYVQGVYVLGGICPGGKCPGGTCPRGDYVLELINIQNVTHIVRYGVQPSAFW